MSSKPEYVNTDPENRSRHRDPFDMSPFAVNPPGGGIPSPGHLPLPPAQQPGHVMGQRAHLATEEWFHGPIPRYVGLKNSVRVISDYVSLSGKMLNSY